MDSKPEPQVQKVGKGVAKVMENGKLLYDKSHNQVSAIFFKCVILLRFGFFLTFRVASRAPRVELDPHRRRTRLCSNYIIIV